MTFLSGTPVECTIHPNLWTDSFSNLPPDPDDYDYEDEDESLDSILIPMNSSINNSTIDYVSILKNLGK